MLLCAAGLTAAYLQHAAVPGEVPAAQELYQEAADDLADRRLPLAQQTLERLLIEYPDSPFSELAIIPLCQIYVAEQPQRAIEILDRWEHRLEESRAIQALAPDAALQAKRLRLRAWLTCTRTEDRIPQLERLAAELECREPEFEVQTLKIRIAAALAAEYERQGEYAAARRQLQSTCDLSDHWAQNMSSSPLVVDGIELERLRHDLGVRLPLAEARDELESGRAASCVNLLKSIAIDDCSDSEKVALHYVCMEACLELDRAVESRGHRQWLLDYIARQTSAPAWAPALAVRQGEALVQDKLYSDASAWLEQCRAEYSTFPRKFEFDLLLARCAIAQVDFETAEQCLKDALACGSADAEVAAKANWLLGELNFLRRQHATAIDYYRQVLPMDAAPQWQARACLQMAKCQELVGDPVAAAESYRRLEQLHPDAESARIARWRLQLLLASLRDQTHTEANRLTQ